MAPKDGDSADLVSINVGRKLNVQTVLLLMGVLASSIFTVYSFNGRLGSVESVNAQNAKEISHHRTWLGRIGVKTQVEEPGQNE